MESYKLLTIRIPEESHQDLKLISVITQRSMTDLILEMIAEYKTQFIQSESGQNLLNQKLGSQQQESRLEEHIRDKRAKAEHKQKMMGYIADLRSDEMTFEDIAQTLQSKAIPTITGKGTWQRGTVYKLYKEWERRERLSLPKEIAKKARWR